MGLYCRVKIENAVFRRWTYAIIVFTVLFISVPNAVEFGHRFRSVPDSCNTKETCSPESGLHTQTKIALIVLASMTGLAILFGIFWVIRHSDIRIKIRRWLRWLWPPSGDNNSIQAGHRNPNRTDRNRNRANPAQQPRPHRTASRGPRNVSVTVNIRVNDSDDDTYYDAGDPILPANPNHNSSGHMNNGYGAIGNTPRSGTIPQVTPSAPSQAIPTSPPQIIPSAPHQEGNEYGDDLSPSNASQHSVHMHASDLEALLADARREGATNTSTVQGGQCAICMDSPAIMMMDPCRHLCMCEECWDDYKDNYNTCPICRNRLHMQRIQRVHLN